MSNNQVMCIYDNTIHHRCALWHFPLQPHLPTTTHMCGLKHGQVFFQSFPTGLWGRMDVTQNGSDRQFTRVGQRWRSAQGNTWLACQTRCTVKHALIALSHRWWQTRIFARSACSHVSTVNPPDPSPVLPSPSPVPYDQRQPRNPINRCQTEIDWAASIPAYTLVRGVNGLTAVLFFPLPQCPQLRYDSAAETWSKEVGNRWHVVSYLASQSESVYRSYSYKRCHRLLVWQLGHAACLSFTA